MSSIMKRRPSPALVVAIVALFVAFSGTATAALVMTGKNIKDGTITGKDVKNRTLGAKKLSKKTVRSLKGQRGPAGPQGVAGLQGPAGPAGPSKAYVDNLPGTITGGQLTRILEVAVEPGSYTVQANLEVHATGPSGTVDCRLRALGGTPTLLDYPSPQFLADVPAVGHIDSRILSLGGGFTSSQGGIVELACKYEGNPVETVDGSLVVTKVGELVAN
jgi:hypothetical protein